jgi:hypothetical protein
MRRPDPSSSSAALLDQHAADDRGAEIARALNTMLSAAHAPSDDKPERETSNDLPRWGTRGSRRDPGSCVGHERSSGGWDCPDFS